MIAQFLDALGAAELDLTGEEIADALWLGSQMTLAVAAGEAAPRPAARSAMPGPGAADQRSADRSWADQKSAATPEGERPRIAVHLPAAKAEGGRAANRRGRFVQSPGVPALPGALAIARSLRPFKRRVASRRHLLLDEEATVSGIAEGGPRVPVFKPAPERWLDLALVVDGSPSMVLWRQTVAELLLLVGCHGAFRDVRPWRMTTDGGQVRLQAGLGIGTREAGRSPRELIEPSGRRLIVVVSDCVAEAWHGGQVTSQALAVWGRSCPTALIQMLPERLWARTGLAAAAEGYLMGPLPGVPSQGLRVRHAGDQWRPVHAGEVPLPALTLEPPILATWAHMVAGFGGAWVPGLLLDVAAVPADGREEATDVAEVAEEGELPTAAQRVRSYNLTASVTARKLAAFLAAAPLSLPVMRLVQAVMLPGSRQVHLAEVFLGGLMRQAVPQSEDSAEEMQYDFEDGVRDLLLNQLRRSEALQVLEDVSAWLSRQQEIRRGFGAVVEDPEAAEGATLSATSLPFASVAATVLSRLGVQLPRQDSGGHSPGEDLVLGEQAVAFATAVAAAAQADPAYRAATSADAGDRYQRQDQLEEAEAAYGEALQLFQQAADDAGAAAMFRALGFIYDRTDRLQQALDAYRRALDRYESIGDRIGKSQILGELGDLHFRAALPGNIKDGLRSDAPLYNQLEDYLEEISDFIRPVADDAKADLLIAQTWYEQALAMPEGPNQPTEMIGILRLLGLGARLLGDFDTAEIWYRQALHRTPLVANPRELTQIYHQLGILARARGDLEAAKLWYERSLEIEESLDDLPRLATTYQQLAKVAQRLGELDAAELWLRRSLAIQENLGLRPGLARTYHELGGVALKRGDLATAEEWYRRSLATQGEPGNLPEVARTYHQLGVVALRHGDLDAAESWHLKSLAIKEKLGDRARLVRSYHELGMVAERRGNLGDAEAWHQKALILFADVPPPLPLPERPGLARTYHQLGILAQRRGNLSGAKKLYTQALEIFAELANKSGSASTSHQLGLVAQELGDLAGAEQWYSQALTAFVELKDLRGQGVCYYQLGGLADQIGDFRSAQAHYLKSAAIWRGLEDLLSLAESYCALGRLAENTGDKAAALEWMVRSVAIFPDMSDATTSPGFKDLARLAAELGPTALALAWRQVTAAPLPDATS